MYSNNALTRNDYLFIRNNYLKKYFMIKNQNLKKTINYFSHKIDNIYNKYLNVYHYLSFKYYTLTEDESLLIEAIFTVL
jgi:hypothetical protein